MLTSNAVYWQAWKNLIFVSYNFCWTAQLLFSLCYFFKGVFHMVHSGLNSVSLGHIVFTVASHSQHGLAPVSLSELIFHSCFLWSSCLGRLSFLGMCRAISFLRVFAFAYLYAWNTNLDLYNFSDFSLYIIPQKGLPRPPYLE